eukprot:COSAG01_NODE_48649_length_379_cov_0.828571_1_plen_29_part_01
MNALEASQLQHHSSSISALIDLCAQPQLR